MKEDKIFNNKFNTGEVEYEVFGKISVKGDFVSRDAHDEYVEGKLQDDLYEIFINSSYYEEFSKNVKQIKKNRLPPPPELESSAEKFYADRCDEVARPTLKVR